MAIVASSIAGGTEQHVGMAVAVDVAERLILAQALSVRSGPCRSR